MKEGYRVGGLGRKGYREGGLGMKGRGAREGVELELI